MADDAMQIDDSAPIRPTRRRLRAAMGLSALIIAGGLAIVGSLVRFSPLVVAPGSEREDPLTVSIRKDDGEPDLQPAAIAAEPAPASSKQQIVAAEPAEPRQTIVVPPAREVPAELPPARDWQAIAKATARASVDEYAGRERSRDAMWRETHSVMFRAAGDFVLEEEAPVLASVRFKPEVHVLGLGVTIGACFIGLPFLGVPIEKRTVAINLFVCADEAG